MKMLKIGISLAHLSLGKTITKKISIMNIIVSAIAVVGLAACASFLASDPQEVSQSQASSSESLDHISGNSSATDKYRITWNTDPTTEATIAWNQKQGDTGVVYYGTVDHKRHHEDYKKSQKVDRVQEFHEMKNCFVRLKGLTPDTEYFYVIKDGKGVSRRLKFRTAASKPDAFTFVAGGDSRNGRAVRQSANLMVSKLKPSFVAFTGDMISKDTPKCWTAWFDDWQETIAKDGTMVPIVAHRGNHEGIPESIYHLFDTPKDAYYSIAIGGDLFRYYALNSMIPADGEQGKWLEADLAKNHKRVTHLVAGYHHPMRPHVKSKREGKNPYKWAEIFYRYGLDVSFESDSHVLKRTLPLKPDASGEEGFAEAQGDKNATVYTGEGCWGAPLRPANDAKSWTLDCVKANGFDWVRVSPAKIQIKTVFIKDVAKVADVKSRNSFDNPEGLSTWQAKGGEIITIAADQ